MCHWQKRYQANILHRLSRNRVRPTLAFLRDILYEMQRLHEFPITRLVKGANGIEACPQIGTVGTFREPCERFLGVNAEYLVFENEVRTDCLDNSPFDLIVSFVVPFYGSTAERKEGLSGFEPLFAGLGNA